MPNDSTSNPTPDDPTPNPAFELGETRRVLVAEDEEDTRNSYKQLIELALKLPVDTAADGGEALEMLGQRPYSVLITDLRMPKLNGMRLIEEIQKRRLPVTVIVTTGHGSIGDAVIAMRMGAYDFLTKPPDPKHVCVLVEKALNERSLQDEVAALRLQLHDRHRFQNVLSKSPKMYEIFELIANVAETNATVLIEGETGTGKEMVARAIHTAGKPGSPFVAVNCAAFPETLLESELFGHEKGSFTGAAGQRKGRFELANGGSLFLDEVGDIPASMQVKLLRVLQERRFERVGGNTPIDVEMRIIAATNRHLETMVAENKFREDLYYRLNVIKIDLPPLRERLEDIPLLAAHFAQKYARFGQQPAQFSPEALELLLGYNWPGNIRQLENVVERASITAREGLIEPRHLPADLRTKPGKKSQMAVDLARPLPDQLAELSASFEERYLRKALKRTRGHVGRCAKLSGLSRRSVSSKIAQYGIDTSSFKGDMTEGETKP
jgi:DNA-binding NtrC family response regulator